MTFALEVQDEKAAEPHDDKGADFWPTPPWVTQLLLQVHSPPRGMIREPHAGDGAIVRELVAAGYEVVAHDIRGSQTAPLLRAAGAKTRAEDVDWLRLVSSTTWVRHPIVGNPPYDKNLLRHVELCLERAPWVALLLPLAFACGGKKSGRWAFWEKNPPAGVYPLAERPSFSGDGNGGTRDVCWFVWDPTVRVATWRPLSKQMLR